MWTLTTAQLIGWVLVLVAFGLFLGAQEPGPGPVEKVLVPLILVFGIGFLLGSVLR